MKGQQTVGSERVNIRPANAADQPVIKKMVRGARLNPMGLKWQRFKLAVTTEDKVVGCIQLKPHRGGALELASLVVLKQWRRLGIGGQLVQHVKEITRPPLWLMCASATAPFYEPFGFRRVFLGQPMPFYFRWTLRLTTLLNRVSAQDFSLTIMVWDEDK